MQPPSSLDEVRPESRAQAADTARARRKLRRASRIALFNWVGLGVSGVLSLALELSSQSLPLTGLVLLGLAWNERRGRALLLGTDPRAPRSLALNQLFLLAAVLVYCIHGAYVDWNGPSPVDAMLQADPELAAALGGDASENLGELSEWARTAALFVYGGVAAGSVLFQSLLALYYLSLRSAMTKLARAGAAPVQPSDR